jgi:hypothetical protein
MPRVGNPAQPTAPAAAINTATPLTRPDEFSGKDSVAEVGGVEVQVHGVPPSRH